MAFEYLIFAGIVILIALVFFVAVSFSVSKSMAKVEEIRKSHHWLQDEMDSIEDEINETYNEMMNLKMKIAVLQTRMNVEPIQEISYRRGPGRPPKE